MKTVQTVNLKHTYNDLPCGSKFFISGKHTDGGETLYMGYTTMRCTNESFVGYFPKSVLQFIGTFKV
jgi:hypothetical protein